MALVSANIQYNRGEHLLLDYSSLQEKYSVALAWAQDPYSNAAVGQFIYISNDETTEDGTTYVKGPYVVDAIGENAVLTPLSKGSAGNAELSDIVSGLSSTVSGLSTDVTRIEGKADDALAAIGSKGEEGRESTGLYKELDNIKSSIENIEVPVTDVKVDGVSVVNTADGVADIDLSSALADYAKSGDVASTYATKDSLSVFAKSDDVYTKSDANTAISDAINLLNVDGVAADGKYVSDVKQVAGKIEVTLADLPTVDVPVYSIVKMSDADEGFAATYRLTKDNDPIGASINIPKDMMVEDGSVVVLADGEVEGLSAGTYIKLTLANSADKVIYIPATSLVDTYKSGNGYITVEGYTITFNYDTLVNDLKSSLSGTFDSKGAASSAAADAISAVNKTLEDYAKTTDVNKTLEDYAKTTDVNKTLEDYAKTEDVNASITLINTKDQGQDARIQALEDILTGYDPGTGEGEQTLVQKVTANTIAISNLKTVVGDDESGLVATTIDLGSRVSGLETATITGIKIGNIDVPVSDRVAHISLVDSVASVDDSNSSSLISAGAVKNAVTDINLVINSKASISLVDAVPGEGDAKVIYLEKSADGKITEKVYVGDKYHVLGEDLYASKALASADNAGLMSTDHWSKLESIESITNSELSDIINGK